MINKKSKICGYTLIELMIATSLASVMSLGVVAVFIDQTSTVNSEKQRDATAQEAHRAFNTISRLLRQAQENSINITYNGGKSYNADDTPELADDGITVNFTLPEGVSIWPNNNTVALDQNAVRLRWNNNTESDDAYKIQVANAVDTPALDGAGLDTIAGSNDGSLSSVINFDLWPIGNGTPMALQVGPNDVAENGYFLRITTRATTPDISFLHADNKTGEHKNFRTYTVTGIIFPRNI